MDTLNIGMKTPTVARVTSEEHPNDGPKLGQPSCGTKVYIDGSNGCTKTETENPNSPKQMFPFVSANKTIDICTATWTYAYKGKECLPTWKRDIVRPMTELKRSMAWLSCTMKNSLRKRYSRQPLSTRANCSLLNKVSNGYCKEIHSSIRETT